MTDQDVNIIAVLKGTERYIFLYHDGEQEALSQVLGRFAADQRLSFTWYDASLCTTRMGILAGTLPGRRRMQ